MNRELTPLKAFDNLCGHLDYDTTDYMFNGSYEEDAEIIETALKKYNQLQIDYEEMNRINDELNLSNHQLRDENIKLRKALKIIKEHKLLNYVIKNQKCAAMYHLSEEEIEYLKGVSK